MSTQASPVAGEDPMVLFQGKRAAQRVRMELPVECSAATGASVPARTVDLSITGALLRLLEPKALGILPEAGLSELAARIAMRFPGGIRLHFAGGLSDLRARVVRVTRPPPPESGVLVGVRFELPLAVADAERLGLPTTPDPGSAAAAASAANAPPLPAPVAPAPSPAPSPPPSVGPAPSPQEPHPFQPAISILSGAPTPAPGRFAPPPTPPPSLGRSPAPPPPGAPGECPASASVYLLPAHAVAPSARVRARRLLGEGLDLIAELPLAADEPDPLGLGAFLGEHPRLVVIHEGRIVYDATVRVERLLADVPGVLRVTLKAERALPVEVAPPRRGPQPADVRARQVSRV